MTNHVHLLVTQTSSGEVSAMMQVLGRRCVKYFNYEYRRNGTFWVGRFKSNLVQTETYLLQCYRHIELNPVQANMVSEPSEYIWSSYRCNAHGVDSTLCMPHEEYLKLGGGKKNMSELNTQDLPQK